MKQEFFKEIPYLERPGKPRKIGLTVIIDEHMGVRTQSDFLEFAGAYIDLAKIAVGISMLLDGDILIEKVHKYHEHDVTVFPGGQFLEYVIARDKTQEYFSAAKEAGYKMVEVSDNLIDISLGTKTDLIKTAVQDFGLKVLGETGSKKVASNIDKLVEDINACLDAGVWRVMFEAAELFDEGRFKADFAKAIFESVDSEKVIFELPGYWIKGITESDVYLFECWLIDNFGSNVNIGNVNPNHVLNMEAERVNLGTAMKFDT